MKIARKMIIFLLILVMCMPVMASASGKTSGTADGKDKNANKMIRTDDFEIQILCGLEGYYRSSVAIPVTVTIESLKDDFEGIARIIVPGDENYGTIASAYEKDIMLSAGTQKVITLSIASNGVRNLSAFRFQLETSSGKVVLDRNVTIKGKVGEEALIGVLSDDYAALNYLNSQSIMLESYTGSTQLLELDEHVFPEQASGLESLSYLIINSFDTSKLSSDQYEAIKRWVEQGGVLIIGTGSDYRQTLSAFQDDFVKGTIGSSAEGTLQLDMDGGEKDKLKFGKNQGLVDLSLEEGKKLKGVLKDSDLIWNRDYGQGHVVVTAFNLGMEPINSWKSKTNLGMLLLQSAAVGYSAMRICDLNYGNGTQNSWSLSNALDGLHDIKYPDMKLMSILFLIFVILAGPGLYLLLKIVDKREFLWILSPVIAVGFTAAVFLVSRDMRIHEPRSASITMLYYDADTEKFAERVNMAIQTPGADRNNIVLDSSLSNLHLAVEERDYYSLNMSSRENYDYKTAVCETAEGFRLGIKNNTIFGSTYLTLDHIPDTKEQSGLEVDLQRKTTGIRGMITNHTGHDLHCVSLYASSTMVMIGELKDGESVKISEKDNKIFEYDLYGINLPGYTMDTREYYQQVNIWQLFSDKYLYNLGSKDVYIYGLADEWDADYITNASVKEKNTAMFIRHESMDYSDYKDAELFNLYDYAKGDNNEWDSDGQMYALTAEVEYDLGAMVSISNIYALKRAKDSEAKYGNTKNTKIYAWNVKTNQYEEIFTDDEIIKFDGECPYLAENGVLKLRFTCNKEYEDYTPQITVIGGVN